MNPDNMAARGESLFRSGIYAPTGPSGNGQPHDGYEPDAEGIPPPDVEPDEPYDPGRPPRGGDERPVSLLTEMISAAQLDAMTFADLVEHVPHLIVEGFGILAGSPKAGKSWLAAGIALACAQGGTALGGISVQARAVLLLALEDGNRRFQQRMRRLNHDRPLPEPLDILTKVSPGTVVATITEWLDRHHGDEHPPLVILDTLGKARPQRRAGDDPYIADYQLGTRIKNTVDAVSGAALVAIHHTRKMGAEDWLDTLSGTQGIAGSADYILVLTRKRKSDEGVLAVTGRDIVENEYAVNTDQGIWSLDGMDILDPAATITARAENAQQSRLGTQSLDAMKFVNSRSTTTPAELADHLGIEGRVAGNLLARLAEAGYILKPSRGTYTPTARGESGDESDETDENAGQSLFVFSSPADGADESDETSPAPPPGNSPLSSPADGSDETESGRLAGNSSLSSDSSPHAGRDKISGGG